MNVSAVRKIALFAAGLLVVFGAAAALGSAFEPVGAERDGGHGMEMSEGSEETMEAHSAHGAGHGPAGLATSEGGYTLRMSTTQLTRGEEGELRFAIEDAAGRPVTGFDELHERRLHLIVVRRDGAEFRHLHPEMDAAGTWAEPIEFDTPGVYRVFADFSVGGEQHTLAADVFVSGGEFEARPFPPAAPVDATDGYEVRLRAGKPLAGEPAELTFTASKDGEEVGDLAPYLGAKGHLVALREGDLAFLHVHPEEDAEPAEIPFAAIFPTAGRYRLYLQFKHDGAVHTAEYTVEVSR